MTGSRVRSLSQAVIVYLVALVMGIGVSFNPLRMVGAAGFRRTRLGPVLDLVADHRPHREDTEALRGIGQVLTMPIFFASSAIYPIDLMASWLRAVASMNPVTYEVDAPRALMLMGGISASGLPLDLAFLLGTSALLVAIAARLRARMAT